VATFLGADNVLCLNAEHQGSDTVLSGSGLVGRAGVPRPSTIEAANGPVHAHFRSEAAKLMPPDSATDRNSVDFLGTIRHASYPGGVWRHSISVAGVDILVDSEMHHRLGTSVHVRMPNDALFFFPADRPTQELQHSATAPVGTDAAA
jgi:hypothetical protein